MPGPSPKPRQLKAIAGTERKDREAPEGVKFDTLSDVPPAPEWLPNAHAVKEWDRCAPILVANNLLTELNLSMLGVMCALLGKIVQLFNAGESPTAHLLSQYNKFCNDFGLPPSSWTKIKPGEPEKPGNPFGSIS